MDRVERFDKDEFPSEVVYGNVDRPELRLITCAGAFNQAERSYEQNAVVFAHLR